MYALISVWHIYLWTIRYFISLTALCMQARIVLGLACQCLSLLWLRIRGNSWFTLSDYVQGSATYGCSSCESHSVMFTLWDPRDYPVQYSPGQNTGIGSCCLLQGIFPAQGSNPGLPHCRRILYHLSHQGGPRILKWVGYPFSSEYSRPRNRTGVSCIAGGFFTSWALREAPPPKSVPPKEASCLIRITDVCIYYGGFPADGSRGSCSNIVSVVWQFPSRGS